MFIELIYIKPLQPTLQVMDKLPELSLPDENNVIIISRKLTGFPMVKYFYPKDETPGCTSEACSFRDHFHDFTVAGAKVIGISSDSPESHRNFKKKHHFPFTLLSDTGNKVRKLFGVPADMLGLIPGRVTYVFNPQGILVHSFKSLLNTEKHVTKSFEIIKRMKHTP